MVPYKKCGDVLVFENTRFKTLEHLLKPFETTLPNLSLGKCEI